MTEPAPQNPFLAVDAPTLADVLALIQVNPGLTPARCRDVASSLRTLARALGREPREVPAATDWLRARIQGLHHEQIGLSKKRWQNVRSDLRFALERAGHLVRHSYLVPMSDAWDAVIGHCEKRHRWNLSRLARFCSAVQVGPDQVDDDVVARFHQALDQESLLKDPAQVVRNAIGAWNKAHEAVAVWPGTALTPLPSRRETYSLPWSAFPESFVNDVDLWLSRLAREDLFADDGPARALRPATCAHRRGQIQRFASAIVHRGVDPTEIRVLADLVSIVRYKLGLRFLIDRAGGASTEAIYGIATALKHVARHHVRVDEDRLRELSALCRRVCVKKKGLRDKNRACLRQFDDPRNVSLLLGLPEQLVRKAAREPKTRKAALKVQMAVAIELLLMAPIRRKNLASLHMERHFVRSRTAKSGIVHLVIPGGEVKNGEDLEFELPGHLVKLIDLYRREYRPLLLSGPNDWLFPGRGSGHKVLHALSGQISRTIFENTGLHVSVHQFRHIGAKLYLDANPGNYEVVRRTLAHSTIDTTTEHYTGFETRSAARLYDETILKLRQSHRRSGAVNAAVAKEKARA